jgi:integrase
VNKQPTATERRKKGLGAIRERGSAFMATVDRSRPDDATRRQVSKTFRTKTEAQAWIRGQLGERERGVVAPLPINVGEYLRNWVNGPDVKRLAPATQAQYSQTVTAYLIPTLGRIRLSNLTPVRIGQALHELAQPGAVSPSGKGRSRVDGTLAPGTVAVARRTLRSALSCAVRDGLVSSNAASAAPMPYRRGTLTPKHEALSEVQLGKVLAVIGSHRAGPLVRFALATGMRQGELLGLRLENTDVVGKVVHVRGSLSKSLDGTYDLSDSTKTERSRRTVPLGQIAVDALRAESVARATEKLAAGRVWADNGLVFSSPIGTPLQPRNVLRAWHEICDAAGIERRAFHHLRHSAATFLLTGGLPLEAVSKLLGHSSIAITSSTYAEVRERLTAPAADVIDNAFAKVAR